MKEQEEIISTLQANVQELTKALFDESFAGVIKKTRSSHKSGTQSSTARMTHPITKTGRNSERTLE